MENVLFILVVFSCGLLEIFTIGNLAPNSPVVKKGGEDEDTQREEKKPTRYGIKWHFWLKDLIPFCHKIVFWSSGTNTECDN